MSNSNLTLLPNQEIAAKIVLKSDKYFIVKIENKKFYLSNIYFYKNKQIKITAEIDDELSFYGNLAPINEVDNFYEHDFKLFLTSLGVESKLIVKNNTLVKEKNCFTIRNSIFKFVNKMPALIRDFTLTLILQRQTSTELKEAFASWGIIAILVVSGFHFNVFFSFLNKFFKFINNEYIRCIFIFIILVFYLYILNWPIAGIRAILFLLFTFICKKQKLKFEKLNIFCLVAFLCLTLAPLKIFQVGWQLSFGISFIITLISNNLKKIKSLWKVLIFSVVIFIFTIPIQMFLNHNFNILSPFYNLIFSPVVIAYYFLLLLNLLFSAFLPLDNLIIFLLNTLLFFIKIFQIADLRVYTPQPSILIIQYYYVFLVLFYLFFKFFNWRLITVIIINFLFVASIWSAIIFKPYYEINMINVGNAMSILLTSPHNKSAILVDTGIETINKENKTIYHYISANGIRTIEAVFLTHNHDDHTNNLAFLNKILYIKKVYTNRNQEKYYHAKSFSKIENLSYDIQNNLSKSSENNKSLVLIFRLYNTTFMVTGDIELETENLLLSKNLIFPIDILQIPHHGSKTSSSINFLQKTKPKTAIISARKSKKLHFPDNLTLNKLSSLKIYTYWTSKNKTIRIRIYKNFYNIITLQ